MISKDYVITAPEGIHARPATALVRLCKQYQSVISLKRGDITVRLNSLLNILAMNAKGGETLSVIVEGPDEALAAEAVDQFFTEQLKDL